jgi:hydrogenase maturation protease
MTSQISNELPTILALGSSHGDDRAAWHVVELLYAAQEFAGRCHCIASPWDVVPYLESGGSVIIVDACQSGAVPGTLHRCVSPESTAVASVVMSSHGGSLREALHLGRSLGCDPSGVVIYGIEVAATERGASLSPEVRRAAETLATEIRDAWSCPPA